MHTLIQLLLHSQNQFASGGLLLMLVGSIVVSLKSIPIKCWAWLVKNTTLTMTMTDENDAFSWFGWWFIEQAYSKKANRVEVFASAKNVAFVPAPGFHWFMYDKMPLLVWFTRAEEKNVANKRNASYTIRMFGRDQIRLQKLVKSIRTAFDEQFKDVAYIKLWNPKDQYWFAIDEPSHRTLDSIVMSCSEKEKILKDIDWFLNAENWFNSMGVPYHRGYLFHGLPGTGKTSLITALANHFKTNVCLLKLSELTDMTLATAVRRVARKSMIVLEDVDCVTVSREDATKTKEEESSTRVTLSGLLNIMDGFQAPQKILFFLTTNYLEKLDPALIRPGRIDFRLAFDYATQEQKQELYSRFFPSEKLDVKLLEQRPKETVAEFQAFLMGKINDTQERNAADKMAA
jgi:chaperone BCS1